MWPSNEWLLGDNFYLLLHDYFVQVTSLASKCIFPVCVFLRWYVRLENVPQPQVYDKTTTPFFVTIVYEYSCPMPARELEEQASKLVLVMWHLLGCVCNQAFLGERAFIVWLLIFPTTRQICAWLLHISQQLGGHTLFYFLEVMKRTMNNYITTTNVNDYFLVDICGIAS